MQIRQGWDNKCFHTKDPSSTEPDGCGGGGVCLKCWCVCSPVHADCCYKLRCNELITSTGCGLWAPDHCELSWGVLAAPVLSTKCFNIYSIFISLIFAKLINLVLAMAFRVVRLRREARRMAKLEEIFTVGWREFLFDVFMSEPPQNLQNILNYVPIHKQEHCLHSAKCRRRTGRGAAASTWTRWPRYSGCTR